MIQAFRNFLRLVSILLAAFTLFVPQFRSQQQVIPVWPGVAPGSENWTRHEVDHLNPQQEAMVRNLVQPTLTACTPAPGTGKGTGVVVCPGGGFRFLSWQSEGPDVARWLT